MDSFLWKCYWAFHKEKGKGPIGAGAHSDPKIVKTFVTPLEPILQSTEETCSCAMTEWSGAEECNL